MEENKEKKWLYPTYSLMVDEKEESIVILKKNGMPCGCGFRIPAVLPTAATNAIQSNQPFTVLPFTCNSQCQFFNVINKNVSRLNYTKDESGNITYPDDYEVQLTCSGTSLNVQLEVPKVPTNPLKGTRFE